MPKTMKPGEVMRIASRMLTIGAAGALALAAGNAVTAPMRQPAPAGQWIGPGNTPDEQRYSPLARIDESNVGQLGLAWRYDLDTLVGVEASPLVVGRTLYNISAWNLVYAHDAKTGKLLWSYDPKVPRERGRYACCEPVSRGMAFADGKAIIATLDGRLIALDGQSGKPLWETRTFPLDWPYSITGAPRIIGDKVVIGNSGADLGVRGFVSAYDLKTGKQVWKFYLVPGDPKNGPDHAASDPIMAMAAKTWKQPDWTLGGGGTAWDAFAYDPKLDIVYVGTGNGSPIARRWRDPGRGDNLFLCSILALKGSTGEYVWHYQQVPGEEWDYTCTQSLILADLPIEGRNRQVVMQAPKNGYFYVLDRRSGELLSAEQYVPNNWASRIDLKTGRPVENPAARYGEKPFLQTPGPAGGHNWFPMAYSPKTRLAYFPAYEGWMTYSVDPNFVPKKFRSNGGWSFGGPHNAERSEQMKEAAKRDKAYLLAWDVAKNKEAWRVPMQPRNGNGGVLVTAGNLVFEGTTAQTFAAFRATDGKKLWEMPVHSAPVAGATTYEIDGEQYVAINAGFGGGAAQVERGAGTAMNRAPARLLVFKLGATGTLPPLPDAPPVPAPPPLRASEDQVQRGAQLFGQTCAVCHGQNAIGGVRDLRHMTPETHAEFKDIVLRGKRINKGMGRFDDILSEADADAIHGYLIARANEDWGTAK